MSDIHNDYHDLRVDHDELFDKCKELEAQVRLQKSNAGGAYLRIEELEAQVKSLEFFKSYVIANNEAGSVHTP